MKAIVNSPISRIALATGVSLTLLTAPPARSQNVADGFAPCLIGYVESVAVQADGKILISGDFTISSGPTSRHDFARLNPDGSVDTSFVPEVNYYARRLVLEPDGGILAGGVFVTSNPFTPAMVRRFDAGGAMDDLFLPELNDMVFALARQADGKVLVGGQFTKAGGQAHPYLARFNTDGTLDTAFTTVPDFVVYDLAVQPDGKILMAGYFKKVNGQTRRHLARLRADGSLDADFNADADNVLRKVTLQADGKILIGGVFGTVNGVARASIARLNSDGTLDMGFNPGANGEVHSLVVQADGKILVAGDFTGLGGLVRERLGRLNPDGSADGYFHPGANQFVRMVAVQADGKVLAGGTFSMLGGQTRNGLGRLYPNGTLDTTASPGVTNTVPGTTNTVPGVTNVIPDFSAVLSLATDVDGSLMVGGYFNGFAGQPRENIARLLPGDCFLDTSFIGRAESLVDCIAVQLDGKMVTVGMFQSLNGQSHLRIGRFHRDGTVDESFNASLSVQESPGPATPSFDVNGMAIQKDGKILVGGTFNLVNGQARTNIARLNSDGSLDTDFNAQAAGFGSGGLRSLAVQPDGKILVGGIFTTLSGQPRRHLGRLNPDGSADLAFNPEANDEVHALALQADGKILVGGQFTMLGGHLRNGIARLNADGGVDPAFNPGATSSTNLARVFGYGVQTDGRIVVNGEFNTLGGATRRNLGRLNPDGTIDASFNPGADGIVHGVAVLPDGKIAVGGSFNRLGGQSRKSFGRLSTGSAALQSLSIDASGNSLTWSRSGSSPEIEQVTVELSLDGVDYDSPRDATRIAGGWRLEGLSLPAAQSVYVRAHGRVTSGIYNGSSGIIESVAQFYRLPAAQIQQFGHLGGGVFQFVFEAPAGRTYTVLATANIAAPATDWEVVGPAEPAGKGLYRFSDPAALSHPRRFYLLRSR